MKDFHDAVADVAEKAGLPRAEARKAVTVPRERDRADLTLPCFSFAKSLKKAPHLIAAEVAGAFLPGSLLRSAEAVGPFVNFRVDRAAWGLAVFDRLAAEGREYGRSEKGRGKRVVLDYGSPNIAKPLLFHHLRSSVIGQALVNLHRRAGYDVVALNFLGDVGTAFGKLMVGIEEFGDAGDADSLNETYVKASRLCAEDASRMDRARRWAKRLEDKDPEAVRHWTHAREISLAGFHRVYDRLGVHHDVVDGEQQYVEAASGLVDALLARGAARESEGAIVLEPADSSLGVLLLRKRDGATLYLTRDLAAAIDRQERFSFDEMLYVVDVAQERHFQQLFSGLKALGHSWADSCRHVAFGQVLMGGRRTATREGRGVLLHEVLDEAERRAAAVIEEKNPTLEDKEAVARAVGVGAVIFSDLGTQIRRDVHFDYDDILSFDGRTGPYLQYAYASAASILRKGGWDGEDGDPALLTHDLEWDLLRRLAELPDLVEKACDACEPSLLGDGLYELAREFRAYHTAGGKDASLRVLVEGDPALQRARLRLVSGVADALAAGLELLGVPTVERM